MRTVHRCLGIFVTLIVLGGAAPADGFDGQPHEAIGGPDKAASLNTRLHEALDHVREQQHVPGCVAAYVLADGRAHAFASGLADVEYRRPMTPETRLMSGSIGKMFVAATALTLVRDGTLDLDAPISRWLGNEPWFSHLPNGDQITLRMLLTHSSGLRDHVFLPSFSRDVVASLATPDYVFPPERLVSYVLDTVPLFPAGRGYAYSDTGYILAGMIIERASGRPYDELVQERILYPLNLSLTSPSAGRIHAGLAQGYVDPQNPIIRGLTTSLERGVYRFNPGSEWTGGGLVTNARDLATWIHALFGGRVLPAEVAQQIIDSKVPIAERRGYGLGAYLLETEFGPLYGHGGWFLGFRSYVAYVAERRTAVAVQCNSDKSNPDAIVHTLLEAMFRR